MLVCCVCVETVIYIPVAKRFFCIQYENEIINTIFLGPSKFYTINAQTAQENLKGALSVLADAIDHCEQGRENAAFSPRLQFGRIANSKFYTGAIKSVAGNVVQVLIVCSCNSSLFACTQRSFDFTISVKCLRDIKQ